MTSTYPSSQVILNLWGACKSFWPQCLRPGSSGWWGDWIVSEEFVVAKTTTTTVAFHIINKNFLMFFFYIVMYRYTSYAHERHDMNVSIFCITSYIYNMTTSGIISVSLLISWTHKINHHTYNYLISILLVNFYPISRMNHFLWASNVPPYNKIY